MASITEYRDYYADLDQLNIFDHEKKLIAVIFFNPDYLIDSVSVSMMSFDEIRDFFKQSFKISEQAEGDFLVEKLGLAVYPRENPDEKGCIMTVVSNSYLMRKMPSEQELMDFYFGEGN